MESSTCSLITVNSIDTNVDLKACCCRDFENTNAEIGECGCPKLDLNYSESFLNDDSRFVSASRSCDRLTEIINQTNEEGINENKANATFQNDKDDGKLDSETIDKGDFNDLSNAVSPEDYSDNDCVIDGSTLKMKIEAKEFLDRYIDFLAEKSISDFPPQLQPEQGSKSIQSTALLENYEPTLNQNDNHTYLPICYKHDFDDMIQDRLCSLRYHLGVLIAIDENVINESIEQTRRLDNPLLTNESNERIIGNQNVTQSVMPQELNIEATDYFESLDDVESHNNEQVELEMEKECCSHELSNIEIKCVEKGSGNEPKPTETGFSPEFTNCVLKLTEQNCDDIKLNERKLKENTEKICDTTNCKDGIIFFKELGPQDEENGAYRLSAGITTGKLENIAAPLAGTLGDERINTSIRSSDEKDSYDKDFENGTCHAKGTPEVFGKLTSIDEGSHSEPIAGKAHNASRCVAEDLLGPIYDNESKTISWKESLDHVDKIKHKYEVMRHNLMEKNELNEFSDINLMEKVFDRISNKKADSLSIDAKITKDFVNVRNEELLQNDLDVDRNNSRERCESEWHSSVCCDVPLGMAKEERRNQNDLPCNCSSNFFQEKSEEIVIPGESQILKNGIAELIAKESATINVDGYQTPAFEHLHPIISESPSGSENPSTGLLVENFEPIDVMSEFSIQERCLDSQTQTTFKFDGDFSSIELVYGIKRDISPESTKIDDASNINCKSLNSPTFQMANSNDGEVSSLERNEGAWLSKTFLTKMHMPESSFKDMSSAGSFDVSYKNPTYEDDKMSCNGVGKFGGSSIEDTNDSERDSSMNESARSSTLESDRETMLSSSNTRSSVDIDLDEEIGMLNDCALAKPVPAGSIMDFQRFNVEDNDSSNKRAIHNKRSWTKNIKTDGENKIIEGINKRKKVERESLDFCVVPDLCANHDIDDCQSMFAVEKQKESLWKQNNLETYMSKSELSDGNHLHRTSSISDYEDLDQEIIKKFKEFIDNESKPLNQAPMRLGLCKTPIRLGLSKRYSGSCLHNHQK